MRVLVFCVGILVTILSGSGWSASDPAVRCTSSKLRAAGEKARARLNCHARGKGTVDPECLARASRRFEERWRKLEAKGGCAATGDVAAAEARVDAFVDDFVASLQPPTSSTTTAPRRRRPPRAPRRFDHVVVAVDHNVADRHHHHHRLRHDDGSIHPLRQNVRPPGPLPAGPDLLRSQRGLHVRRRSDSLRRCSPRRPLRLRGLPARIYVRRSCRVHPAPVFPAPAARSPETSTR